MTQEASAGRDRRQFPRLVLELPVTAVRRNAPPDNPQRAVRLHVLNVSRGGIVAVSQEAFQPAEPVVVFFPPMGAREGRDTVGAVVRCEGRDDTYRIAIAFEEPWPESEVGRPH